MADHNELGKSGEEAAVGLLVRKGYTILETNWRYKKVELDIIARIGEELVFVEVKTRTSDFFGDPQSFVNKKKRGSLVKAANAYLIEKDLDIESRFDIIAILSNSKAFEMEHIEHAFYPMV